MWFQVPEDIIPAIVWQLLFGHIYILYEEVSLTVLGITAALLSSEPAYRNWEYEL
ncbi:MAG: hypothetical protein F6J95_003545 [Leptolyngbya sp. SIO1E4]|nr:hypothetical protein [Leptolyngbya sp. SIO1E4]